MTIMEKGALVRALYNNRPETKNELFFRKGDILTVIERDFDGQPGWWLCALRGQRGICPSNYLEVLEDKYSVPDASTIARNNIEGVAPVYMNDPCGTRGRRDESVSLEEQQQKKSIESLSDFVDPIETYDFPRSVAEPVPSNPSLLKGKCSSVSALVSSRKQRSNPSAATTASLPHLHLESLSVAEEEDEHTYSDDLSPEFTKQKSEPLYMNDANVNSEEERQFGLFLAKTNPLDLYDVPRNELPIYGQSLTRLRKYGSCSTGDELNTPVGRATSKGKSLSSLNFNNSNSSTGQVQLRTGAATKRRQFPIQRSNRSSIESGIGMGHQQNSMESAQSQSELYDVPRGTTFKVPTSSSSSSSVGLRNGQSRPQSALSYTSSGMGMSIATSDSKDSLDCLYDVPRTSIKAYVNHMETKYDDVMAARKRHDSSSSTSSQNHSRGTHSRHNSTSSIFSAYGYTRKPSEMTGGKKSSASVADPLELYDVPRGTCAHPPIPAARSHHQRRPSSSSISSNGSMNGVDRAGEEDPMMFYDIPSQFTRKVSLPGVSSSSVSASSLAGSQFSLGRSNGNLRESTNGVAQSSSVVLRRHNTEDVADVKILPLGPKAAVSVCEKLRQEVVSSIGAILNHVKPKWRTKENLTEIMPDLKFSCTRLCLAIKDVADFAIRSLSNAKRLSEDPLIATRLHRLLTPVINGSQIIQRDVDELDAYFWSVDRLSISSGEHNGLPTTNSFSSGSSSVTSTSSSDALDQLILCARSLKHDVTELANFLALHSTALYKETGNTAGEVQNRSQSQLSVASSAVSSSSLTLADTKVEDTQEDYDYVSLVPTCRPESESGSNSVDSQKLSSASSTSTVSWHLDSKDQQLLEFYSAQISVTAPQLSQSISTFISAIQQNEPPSVFNIHLKYVILLGYKLLFAGDTVHRNIGNPMLKEEVELRANELHKAILALYEASKVATVEFPKIQPMQQIVDKVWATTQCSTQLKKTIFNAVYTPV